MDVFAEQLIVKQQTDSDKKKLILKNVAGVIAAAAFIAVAMLMLSVPVISLASLIAAVACGVGVYFNVQNFYVEYEYAFTNGELDIDKIIAKKKRKHLISVNVAKFSAFGKYLDDTDDSGDMTLIIASSNIASEEYYADFPDEEYGNTRLVFCPNEDMLEVINKSLPRALRAKK